MVSVALILTDRHDLREPLWGWRLRLAYIPPSAALSLPHASVRGRIVFSHTKLGADLIAV